jgi:hypothetical protein
MMHLNGTARQLIWQLCLYSLITTSNSLNQAFVCREKAGSPWPILSCAVAPWASCPAAELGISKEGYPVA